MKKQKLCYIAGKFRGKNHWEIHQNVINAEYAIPEVIEMGYIPICPHKLTENLQGLYPDEKFLEMCLCILEKCDAIYMLANWRESLGSCEELMMAGEWDKEIIYQDPEQLYRRTGKPSPFDFEEVK